MTRNGPRNINNHCREMDAALEARPPVIVWEKDKRGVMVAVEVHDPHAESTAAARAERRPAVPTRAEQKAAAKQLEEARLRVVELMQTEADEVADRFRKHRADNTPLMTAARRAL